MTFRGGIPQFWRQCRCAPCRDVAVFPATQANDRACWPTCAHVARLESERIGGCLYRCRRYHARRYCDGRVEPHAIDRPARMITIGIAIGRDTIFIGVEGSRALLVFATEHSLTIEAERH